MIPSADWALQRAFIETSIKTAWPTITKLYLKSPETANVALPYAVAKPTFAVIEGGASFEQEAYTVTWELFFVWVAPDSDEVSDGVAYLDALAEELLVDSVPGGGMIPMILSADPVSMDADHEKRRVTTATYRYQYHRDRS